MRPWSVRVHGPRGICGAGVLLDPHHVLTCAHVVNTALGRPPDASEPPADPIELDFPFTADGHRVSASVAAGGWFPIQGDERGDVAVLTLAAPAPDGAAPAVFHERAERGTAVHAYGYPPGVDTGVWAVSYEVGDPGGPEWIQLDATRPIGRRIEHGFSGAAVERLDDGRVVGIVVTEDPTGTAKVAWMLPTSVLSTRWRLPHVERSPHDGLRVTASRPAGLADAAPEVAGVLRIMRQVADDLPYPLRGGHGRLPLSGVYVRQSVTASSEPRRPWEDGIEDGPEEERRPGSGLSQPFEQVFERHDHLVIEGAAGLGKSTLGRVLTRHMAERVLSCQDAPVDSDTALIPIMLPARVLAAHLDRSWPEALQASVTAEYGRPDGEVPAGVFSRPLHGLRWLIVVDALDEIPDQDDRERLLTALAARVPDGDGPARYLITTRPLSPGEIDRLRGPRVGFYALQPFDDEALREFARNWFDPGNTPSGDAAAEEFLRQVRLAGLEEILEVPLLATVAAHVHQSRRDRPLPAGRYELYEEYMAQFARARSGTAATTLAPLDAVPDGPALATWLREHQADLMEALATAYTTSETALIEVARRYLSEHAPTPARLPHDWDDVLAEWLCHSGILGRSGTRLRFLHQTFAEHLAATAHAKILPEFHPGEPPWDALIRDLLLEDETAERVLLHHLHLTGPDGGPLDWLQRGTLDQRACADQLVDMGAPTSEAQLDAYLVRAEDRARTDSADLGGLLGLTRHAEVRRRLEALVHDSSVGEEAKIQLIDVLRERSDDVRRDGPFLLRALLAADRPARIRCQAATALARFGGEHRARAAETLITLGGDPATGIGQRLSAVESLSRLGGDHRTRAGAILHDLATDPAVNHWSRIHAGEELAKLGGEHRVRAAEALREVASDTGAQDWFRRAAAQTLAGLGGAYYGMAMDLLRGLANDLRTDKHERGSTLAIMALLDTAYRREAAAVLTELATDLGKYPYYRRVATEELADLGRDERCEAARILFELAMEPHPDADERFRAAEALSELGHEFRSKCVEALDLLGNDLASTAAFPAASKLAVLGVDGQARAAGILLRLAASPAVAVEDRFEVATTLAKLGDEHSASVLGLVRALLEDPFTSTSHRVLAAAVWAALRPQDGPATTALIHQLGTATTTEPKARLLASRVLGGMGHRGAAQAAGLLHSVATDQLVDAYDRRKAAEELASFGSERRDQAAAVLGELAADPTDESMDQPQAAETLAALGGVHRERAIRALRRLAADPTRRQGWERSYAVRVLLRQGTEQADEAVACLHDLATDPAQSIDSRGRAAKEFAQLRPWYRTRAIEIIRGLVDDPMGDDLDKPHLLATISELDNSRRADVAEALHLMATNPLMTSTVREAAVWHLMRLDDKRKSWAEAALRALAEDSDLGSSARRRVAKERAKLGGESRRSAATLLYRIALDPGVDPGERAEAAQDLATLGGEHRDQAADALFVIATEAHAAPDVRCSAAWQLIVNGGGHRGRGIEILDEFAHDQALDPDDRLNALRRLARLGPATLSRAVNALDRLAREPGAGGFVRRWAAESLARMPSPHTDALAVEALGVLAEDAEADSWNRFWAVERLMTMGPEARRRALRVVKSFSTVPAAAEPLDGDTEEAAHALTDTTDTADTAGPLEHAELPRVLAVACLADIGEGHHFRAVDLLIRVSEDRARTGRERILATLSLLRIGPLHHERGALLLHSIASDRAVRAWERRQAAETLARLGHRNRVRAARLLRAVVGDDSADPWERGEAALALDSLDLTARPDSVAALRQIAGDPAVPIEQRHLVTDALLLLGREGRRTAIETLQDIGLDVGVVDDARRRALLILARQEDAPREVAFRALAEMAGNPGLAASTRRRAALDLADMGKERRTEAVRALRLLISDPQTDTAHRALALDALSAIVPDAPARPPLSSGSRDSATEPSEDGPPSGGDEACGPSAHSAGRLGREAGEALLRAARDASVPPPLRFETTQALISRHAESLPQAVEVLRELATLPSTSARERLAAIQALARLKAHNPTLPALREFAVGVTGAPYEQAMVLFALASVDPSQRSAAAALAIPILERPGVPPEDHLDIAVGLAGLGPRYLHPAVMALHRLATDPSGNDVSRYRAAGAIADLVGDEGRVRGPLWLREHVE
ncbi:hypothetical protein Skr01_04230 [Sphaerisporangium krabiense]|uniref:NACHT domain-containing protein n=1 Tax=Sphaerisporangium krabiense TaxID=763782 RepID=A0A7W8Z7L6_9ACTN|nr:serine protease [Sphaerisporangium krabiense]MBB5628820.1 hypothetical protein [Sphaerisporangium krabiense]GII60338.1 hypothetical protein Skr01_04230 [Sphaerisporangium krabiense]